MSSDRFVYFKKRKPKISELKLILEDYVDGIGATIDYKDKNTWIVSLPGKPSFPFKRIYPDQNRSSRHDRWFEVWVGSIKGKDSNIDVITRQQDEITNVIASGFGKLIARFYEGLEE